MQPWEPDDRILIGRDSLLEEARLCLSDVPGHRRILLLSGGRGIGKSALAENCNDAMFELALGDIRKSGWSLDLPRVTLVYGEWRRRNHRILDSRRHLVQVVALFDGPGARARRGR